MIEYSQKLKQEAKKIKVPVQTLIMADLMAIGYGKADAYNIAYFNNASFSRERNKTIRDSITDTDAFDELVAERSKLNIGKSIIGTDDAELMADLDVAKDILRSARQLPDGKERAELMSKFYDIKKKIGAADDGKDVVRIWLPLTCHICPFYKKETK